MPSINSFNAYVLLCFFVSLVAGEHLHTQAGAKLGISAAARAQAQLEGRVRYIAHATSLRFERGRSIMAENISAHQWVAV